MGLRVRLSGIHPANHPLAELEPQPTSVGTGQFVGCHGWRPCSCPHHLSIQVCLHGFCILTLQSPQIEVVQGIKKLMHLPTTKQRGIRISGGIEWLRNRQKTLSNIVQVSWNIKRLLV